MSRVTTLATVRAWSPDSPSTATERELARRLPWLLVFRATVACAVLLLTLLADLGDLPLSRISSLLYGVAIGNFMVVVVLGLLLRAAFSPVVLAAVYLAGAVMTAVMAVQGTGVIESELTFLFLLAILDAAIIGGRRVAMATATASALAYGTQLLVQLYGFVGTQRPAAGSDWDYTWSALTHLAAFYLLALLASYLAELVRSARAAESAARVDLRLARQLHEVVLESLPLGVLTFDASGAVRTANAAALRIIGEAYGELVDCSSGFESLPKELCAHLPRVGGHRQVRVAKGARPRSLFLTRAAVDRALAPEREGLEVLVVEDRTSLSELEESLRAKERLASIGEVAAGIAHELRNPLAAISGAVELLAAAEDAAEQARLRSIVLREIERLDRLLEQFLGYARPAPAERAPVDIAALARELCDVLAVDPCSSGHALCVAAPDRLIAEVDARQLRQVLWNLVLNALEASPPRAPVDLELLAEGSHLVIEVRDEGAGIEPSVRDYLFEPFRTSKPGGTGLGLAVVYRIVDGHGGTVTLAARATGGTVARVVMPLAT